ncbi:hypothetical protein MMC25_003061 [Agyrium rufum]|nr:hypothetical protein [Agyrium rufum]
MSFSSSMSTIVDGERSQQPLLEEDDEEKQRFSSESLAGEDNKAEVENAYAKDPFRPFDDLPDEDRILSIRAVVVGVLCGALINVSNLYLGLKSGFTASANIFGSIIGFTVLKNCAKHFPKVPIIGGTFGPRENNIVQTAATASGGLSWVFISAFPAMYQLNLLTDPLQDFWKLTLLSTVGAFLGLFFATPLRKFFIIHAARDLNLLFPSSSATAITIRGMHLAAEQGRSSAQSQMNFLAAAFVVALIMRVISQLAIGIFWDWHVFTWIFIWGGYHGPSITLENWGWFIEWTPAFIGSGMLVGLNVALSFVGGSILAWGIIGPLLVRSGIAFGDVVSSDPQWSAYISYASLSEEFATSDHPSPRYWLLWPGVACMIAVALTELACQWRLFWKTGSALYEGVRGGLGWTALPEQEQDTPVDHDSKIDEVEDPALPEDMVPTRIWLSGLIIMIVVTCLTMKIGFAMPIPETLLALLLSAIFAFLAIQATGATDITPLTAASKASQIVLATATKGHGWTITKAQSMNLLGGALAAVGAGQAADLTSDFRVGFLLRTPPKLQWSAQAIGTLCACFIAPATFVLFSTAYPCINDASAASCPFQAPNVQAWRAVAVAMTNPTLPIPSSSVQFSIAFAAMGTLSVLMRSLFWKGRLEWMRAYHPSMMAMAMAFVIPATIYSTAMAMGALVAWTWSRKYPASWELYGHAIAAGLMAGEGIGGVINAGLATLGISSETIGTQVGCPGGVC